MHVVDVKRECDVIHEEAVRLSRVVVFLVYLSFQTKIEDLDVKHRYLVFGVIIGGTGNVQGAIMLPVRLVY
jgi:hypothetical protein